MGFACTWSHAHDSITSSKSSLTTGLNTKKEKQLSEGDRERS